MKQARVWFGVGISLLCLVLALWGVQWGQVWRHLVTAHYPYLVGASLVLTLGSAVRAFRWRLLFLPRHDLSPMRLFAIINIGYLLINILPARLGELARVYLISRGGQVNAVRALSTIVVERMYDTLFALLLLGVVSSFAPLPPWATQGALVVGAATVALALVLFTLAGQRSRLLRVWHWATGHVGWLRRPGLEDAFNSGLDGLTTLRRMKVALGALCWSTAVWACNLLTFYLVMQALKMDLPWSAAGLTVSVIALSMIIPSSPGYVGVFEEGVVLSLGLFDVGREAALAYALLLHALVYVVPSLWGLVGFWQEGLLSRDSRGGVFSIESLTSWSQSL
jgi:uncharacterized protein (TIRG00374 family)